MEIAVTIQGKDDSIFSPSKKVNVIVNVNFSKKKRPVDYVCEFGFDKKSNLWFMLNSI